MGPRGTAIPCPTPVSSFSQVTVIFRVFSSLGIPHGIPDLHALSGPLPCSFAHPAGGESTPSRAPGSCVVPVLKCPVPEGRFLWVRPLLKTPA